MRRSPSPGCGLRSRGHHTAAPIAARSGPRCDRTDPHAFVARGACLLLSGLVAAVRLARRARRSAGRRAARRARAGRRAQLLSRARPVGRSHRSRAGDGPAGRDRAGSRLVSRPGDRRLAQHRVARAREPFTGREPSLEDHFFERIRPIVEQALREKRTRPLAAHRAQPRSQVQRARASRRDLEDARRPRVVAHDRRACCRWIASRCRST